MNLLNGYENLFKSKNILPEWVDYRLKAKQEFEKMGLPTRKQEAWKYTNLKLLADTNFMQSLSDKTEVSPEMELKIRKKISTNFYNIVFVNGEWQEHLSDSKALGGLEVATFKDILTGKAPNFKSWKETFLKLEKTEKKEAFSELNAAFTEQGVAIHIKSESALAKPVQLLFYSSSEPGAAVATYPRIWVVVGQRAKATFIESYFGDEEGNCFNNAVTEILLQDSATFEYLRVQADSESAINMGTTKIYLKKNSNLESLVLSTGAQLSRHNLNVNHIEPGATSKVNGVYISNNKQQMDHYTNIDHQVGECQSSQHYKGILDGESRAVFNGQVVIRKGADKASSEQLNNNLVLSPLAEIDTKPQLEIYADDVKATHGSTVGQLSLDEIFYLESRAISKVEAIKMLSFGFVAELIYKISNSSARNWAREILTEKYQKITKTGDV